MMQERNIPCTATKTRHSQINGRWVLDCPDGSSLNTWTFKSRVFLSGSQRNATERSGRYSAWEGLDLLLMGNLGFPCSSVSKKICLQCRRPRFDSWVRKIPWRRKCHPTPVFLSEQSYGQRNLVGSSPWGRKESDMTEYKFYFHLLLILWINYWCIHLF